MTKLPTIDQIVRYVVAGLGDLGLAVTTEEYPETQRARLRVGRRKRYFIFRRFRSGLVIEAKRGLKTERIFSDTLQHGVPTDEIIDAMEVSK